MCGVVIYVVDRRGTSWALGGGVEPTGTPRVPCDEFEGSLRAVRILTPRSHVNRLAAMTTRHDRVRKGTSIGITALMLLLSVAIPVLERAEVVNVPVAESEHDPATCPAGHDHTVCAQVGANLSAPTDTHGHRQAPTTVGLETVTEALTVASAAFPEGHPSRAPPLA